MEYQKPFIDEWPDLSFDQIENIEIEDSSLRLFYKSFFQMLRLPENTVKAFIAILNHQVE